MENQTHPFTRTEWLIGPDALNMLKNSRVAIFGVGGVGSWAAEALARSGVGSLTLIDRDVISLTNINRQCHALHSTLGRPKTEVMRERILDINPSAEVATRFIFFMQDTDVSWDYDYVIDAVDTVTAKLQIILSARKRRIPVISMMGAGNKINPSLFQVADIYKTQYCPLAKIMRKLCREHQIEALKTVFSTEAPLTPAAFRESSRIGSMMPVTATAGLLSANEVMGDLCKKALQNLDNHVNIFLT